jgi:DNA modification methylase
MLIRQSDNLDFMNVLKSTSIDLIYSDVLYGTGKTFKDFSDIKSNKIDVYDFYAPRVEEFFRLLKPTGSVYLQCDTKINHWLRCILEDCGFIFRNEIVWNVEYRLHQNSKKFTEFGERILFYTKSDNYYYSPQKVKHLTTKEHQERCRKVPSVQSGKFKTPFSDGKNCGDVWNDIKPLTYKSKENTGYSTQKPEKLIERIVMSSSQEGDTVADFFLGSGTTAVVSKRLNRNFIGCDINIESVEITNRRLKELV